MKNICIPLLQKNMFLYIIYKMYMTLKLDDNGCCRIQSLSDDGNGWIVINERYVVMSGRWLPEMVQT